MVSRKNRAKVELGVPFSDPIADGPVCIGIGVKTVEDVKALNKVADGVIVGTRIVEFIEAHRDKNNIGALMGD